MKAFENSLLRSLLILALLWSGSAQSAEVVAGPMAGLAAMRQAVVWFQAEAAAQAEVEFWPEGQPQALRRSTATRLTAKEQFTASLPLTGLEPGRRYQYRVALKEGGQVRRTPVQDLSTQPLWQWRSDPPDFSVGFGSCAYFNDAPYDRPGTPYGADDTLLDAMAATKPDLVLWLGDNLYFREADNAPWGMADRYQRTRRLPALQKLLRTGQHIAIWDDHDYGPNDANRSFIFKQSALELFRRYWPNPSYGQPEAPGIYTVASFGDADFFLLDDRWYRDHDGSPDFTGKQMFGPQQMAWLKNALSHSTATFKIIAGGSQMLNDQNPWEGWNHFGTERSEFLSWLDQAGIGGVLFLSGDRHHTELLRIERPGKYPLLELTCSPLTAGPAGSEEDLKNLRLVAGTYVKQRNFCRLEFSGKKAQRQLRLSAHDANGTMLWFKQISSGDLNTK